MSLLRAVNRVRPRAATGARPSGPTGSAVADGLELTASPRVDRSARSPAPCRISVTMSVAPGAVAVPRARGASTSPSGTPIAYSVERGSPTGRQAVEETAAVGTGRPGRRDAPLGLFRAPRGALVADRCGLRPLTRSNRQPGAVRDQRNPGDRVSRRERQLSSCAFDASGPIAHLGAFASSLGTVEDGSGPLPSGVRTASSYPARVVALRTLRLAAVRCRASDVDGGRTAARQPSGW